MATAHRRAAGHDAAHGDPLSALEHASQARDDLVLADLLVELAPAVLCGTRAGVVGTALASLPADALERFPHLLGVAGLQRRAAGDVAGALARSTRADEALRRLATSTTAGRSPADDALSVDALLLTLWGARLGLQDAAAAIARAYALLGCLHDADPGSPHTRGLVVGPERLTWLLVELAAAEIWTGRLAAAAIHLDAAVLGARAVKLDRLLASAQAHQSALRLKTGQPAASHLLPAHHPRSAVLDGFPVRLTARESDVLDELALGGSYAEIGQALFITENTRKTHPTGACYRQASARGSSRSAALRVARCVGLL